MQPQSLQPEAGKHEELPQNRHNEELPENCHKADTLTHSGPMKVDLLETGLSVGLLIFRRLRLLRTPKGTHRVIAWLSVLEN